MCIAKNLFIGPLGENLQVPIVCYWTTIFAFFLQFPKTVSLLYPMADFMMERTLRLENK